jgi:hypothetical protein
MASGFSRVAPRQAPRIIQALSIPNMPRLDARAILTIRAASEGLGTMDRASSIICQTPRAIKDDGLKSWRRSGAYPSASPLAS